MSERLIASVSTFVSVTFPTLIEGIVVRYIPEGAPAGNGSVGFNPAASAYGASRTEPTFPVSIPIFKLGPLPIRASTHGRPSQSSSGTSVANFTSPAPSAGARVTDKVADTAKQKMGSSINIRRMRVPREVK